MFKFALRVVVVKFSRHFSMSPSAKDMPAKRRITIRREPKSEYFEMHFRVNVPDLELTREFNLVRRVDEKVHTLLARLKTNMEKAFGKKLRKTKSKLKIETGSKEEKKFLQITADMRKEGKVVPTDITCEQVLFNPKIDRSQLTFHLCGLPFEVDVNVPYIRTLNLPEVAMVGLPVFPLKFVLKFAERETSKFVWYSGDGTTWSKLQEGFCYRPTEDDVGKLLKIECTPSNEHRSGEPVTAVMSKPVGQSPGVRPYQRRHTYTTSEAKFPAFRVISYNILANKYAETEAANNELFPYCPPQARAWQYRRGMIVDELMGYNGDVICLQEVDTKAFEYDLTCVLKSRFRGLFNKKYTAEEGVATFFNRHRFKLLSNHTCYLGWEVDTNELFTDIWDKIKGNAALCERLKSLGTVGQAAVLSDLQATDKVIVVGNTHLFFHPDADHIRLIQGGMYAKFLADVVSNARAQCPANTVSLVACGDLNSVPSCGIFSLFTKGVAPSDLPDWRSKEGEHVEGLELRQPLNIGSAYGTPQYTNFTQEFADCLDYIYYQKDRLKVASTVPLLTEEELRAHTALPSVVCPSDHIALVADIAWAKTHVSTLKSPTETLPQEVAL